MKAQTSIFVLTIVLCMCSAPLEANPIIYSSLGPGNSYGGGGWGFGYNGGASHGYEMGFGFIAGSSRTLSKVYAAIQGNGQIDLLLMSDDGFMPGSVIESFSFSGAMLQNGLLQGISVLHPSLQKGQWYWLIASAPIPYTGGVWNMNDQMAMDPRAVRIFGTPPWSVWPDEYVGAYSIIGTVVPELPLPVSPGGAATWKTAEDSGATQVGYATLMVNSGANPYGTAVLSFKQNGVTVTEAGAPASPPTTRARVFIDYRSDVLALPGQSNSGAIDINTGIAVVNTGTATANVTYTLRDTAGSTLAIGNGTIAAGAHFAKFINQLKDIAPNFNLPSNFQNTIQFASLAIASDQPLSVLALRGTNNQRNDFLITTTPIADLTQSISYDPVYFPQFADGGGYTTSLVLLNTSNTTERGTLQILDNNGSPLVVNQVGGTTGSSFSYAIAPGGAFRFQTDGSPAGFKIGWARLIPFFWSPTPIGSGLFSYNPGPMLISESDIPSAVSTTHARVYVDLSGDHNTGLAIANVGSSNASITINAFQTDGSTSAGTSQGPLQLAAYGHEARFADQFITGLPAGFTGVLDISSATPFAALTMRSLVNERDDFLMTTFPIADANAAAPSPIVFPQVVDGSGYATQFILISSGGAASTTLSFYDESGAPTDFSN